VRNVNKDANLGWLIKEKNTNNLFIDNYPVNIDGLELLIGG